MAQTEDGNTSSSSALKEGPRGRNWTFTWNSANVADILSLKTSLEKYASKYLFQREVGAHGTPHIQGAVTFNEVKRFAAVKKIIPEAHWELTRNVKAAFEYCQKADTWDGVHRYSYGFPKPLKDEMAGLEYKPWQKEILTIMTTEPDMRKIYWYWDDKGGCGKTTFTKHLCMKFKEVLCVSGKANDAKYAISEHIGEGKEILAVVWMMTRSMESFVSYEGIEAIKDGIFFCGKYESKQCIYNRPHLFVFANFQPAPDKLSKDRLVVQCIDEVAPGGAGPPAALEINI